MTEKRYQLFRVNGDEMTPVDRFDTKSQATEHAQYLYDQETGYKRPLLIRAELGFYHFGLHENLSSGSRRFAVIDMEAPEGDEPPEVPPPFLEGKFK